MMTIMVSSINLRYFWFRCIREYFTLGLFCNLKGCFFLFKQLQPSSACAGPVITCFYHRLVQAVRWHWEQWAQEKDSPIKSKGTQNEL